MRAVLFEASAARGALAHFQRDVDSVGFYQILQVIIGGLEVAGVIDPGIVKDDLLQIVKRKRGLLMAYGDMLREFSSLKTGTQFAFGRKVLFLIGHVGIPTNRVVFRNLQLTFRQSVQ